MVRSQETDPEQGAGATVTPPAEPEPVDRDERVGEAIEAYLALAEAGNPPDPEAFAAQYPDLAEDLLAGLEGLALVRGLVGQPETNGPGGRLETGRRVAGYRIVRELGRGGMGVVYEAVHVGLDRPVALKVLGTHAAPDSNGRRRFLNEARTAAGLHHTHIVPVFDVGQVGGLCYYAMQRIEGSGLDRVVRHLRRDRPTAAGSSAGAGAGSSLKSWTRLKSRSKSKGSPGPARGSDSATGTWHALSGSRGLLDRPEAEGSLVGSSRMRDRDDEPPPFNPPRGTAYYRWVAEIGRAAADALGHAHTRGVIHRDVKPSNLLVDGRGFVWVADFGLARRMADPGLTQHDSLLGTPRYMSPEQARPGPIDGRSDLFSLGATLYELLTMRPPFEGRSAAELVEQIANREAPLLRSFDPRIPRDLETIVLKLLAKRPGDRYLTATELTDDLDRFLNYEPVKARRISPVGRLWRFSRRHPGISIVSTAAVITVLAVSTWAHVRVVRARDDAYEARDVATAAKVATERAMKETEKANLEMKAEMRTRLLQQATLTRISKVPDRRAEGLKLILDAAKLRPEPELRAKLRNEAAEFMVMRDVEGRAPLPIPHSRGITFNPAGKLLALTVPEEQRGESIQVWDLSGRRMISERAIPFETSRRDDRGPGGPGGGGGPGNRGPRRGPTDRVSTTDDSVAVFAPEAQGLHLFDLVSGERLNSLRLEGHSLAGAMLVPPYGHRLVTTEYVLPTAAEGRSAQTQPSKEGRPALFQPPKALVVNLWESTNTTKPLATLDRWDFDPKAPNNRFLFHLMSLSPDGKTVAVSRSSESNVSLFATETGQPLGEISVPSEITALTLGPNNQLATAGGGEVRLWDIESKISLASFADTQNFIRLLRFSTRGRLLAIVGVIGREVELWDTASHAVVAVLPTTDRIEDVAFSPDGQTLVATGQTGSASVWAVVEPDVRIRLAGFDGPTRSMAFRADGLLALGTMKGTIRFWSGDRSLSAGTESTSGVAPVVPAPEAPREEAVPRDHPASLAFDAKGRLLTLEPDALRVWDAPPRCAHSSVVALPEPKGNKSQPGTPFGWTILAPSTDGRTMVVARTSNVWLWRPSEMNAPILIEPPPPSRNASPPRSKGGGGGGGRPPTLPSWRALAVNPDGDRLFLVGGGGGNSQTQAWALDSEAGTVKARRLSWDDLPPNGSSLAIRPDGRVLAVGDNNGGITLIDIATGKASPRLTRPPGGAEGSISTCLAFSPDGQELAVGTEQGHVDLWLLSDLTAPPIRLPGHHGRISSLAFDAHGRHLASAVSDKTVDVWDLEQLREEFGRLGLGW